MKLLALADIHGNIKNIPLLADAAKGCDVILLAGDITDFGTAEHARSILSALSTFGKPVWGVSGNCDPVEVDQVLVKEGFSLMNTTVQTNGVLFAGFPCPAIESGLLQTVPVLSIPVVLVSHQPAWGTDVDLQAGTRHKGSQAVRSFIEQYQPQVAVSGHIHEARGTDRLGSTLLVNPGPFRNGCYAIIELKDTMTNAHLYVL